MQEAVFERLQCVAAVVVVVVKLTHVPKPSVLRLVRLTYLFTFLGAVASLIYTIVWMIWYEHSTGYSAGNARLGWIFFNGPVSAALGQLVALIAWWFKKPSQTV
jgi:hypothetical protein